MAKHVHHLLVAYVHRQLPAPERNRVFFHIQRCEECRAALDMEQQLTRELASNMALIGRPLKGQIARLWPDIWSDLNSSLGSTGTRRQWLPSYSLVFLAVVFCVFLASGLFGGQAIAAPLPGSPAFVLITETPNAMNRPATATDIAATSAATKPADETARAHFLPSASPAPLASARIYSDF